MEQPSIINQHNMSMGGFERMDQNISAYTINLRTKRWWWPLFRFVVDAAVNNAYQIYRQSHLNPGEYRLGALGFHRAIVDACYRQCRKSAVTCFLKTTDHQPTEHWPTNPPTTYHLHTNSPTTYPSTYRPAIINLR